MNLTPAQVDNIAAAQAVPVTDAGPIAACVTEDDAGGWRVAWAYHPRSEIIDTIPALSVRDACRLARAINARTFA